MTGPWGVGSNVFVLIGNPEYAKLRRSIEEFGLVDPIIWNSRTKRVVGGHQRLTVLRDLGHTSAPTVVVDLVRDAVQRNDRPRTATS